MTPEERERLERLEALVRSLESEQQLLEQQFAAWRHAHETAPAATTAGEGNV